MAAKKHRYTMTISRTTIDKLGIKLYDRPSGAIAELVANAYDADAHEVAIEIPCNKWLAKRTPGRIQHLDYEIVIRDNGHGMTPDQVNEFYLKVGINRRDDPKQGHVSKKYGRKVMGRKGIGKFAPFGICQKIEILSAGGKKTDRGYLTSHLFLDYKDITQQTDQPYHPKVGEKDGFYSPKSGTTIRLFKFQYRRTPSLEVFCRQLARIFGIKRVNWSINVIDTIGHRESTVGDLGIVHLDKTMITVDDNPVVLEDGTTLPVSGWIAFTPDPYKDELMAGVRIYARGKIVSQTRDFGLQAGFWGEHTLRSYLVGEIHADWLDDDQYEDLIRTDRQDILWSDERCEAFKLWGQELLKKVARESSGARREKAWQVFLAKSKLKEVAEQRFADVEIRKKVMEVGKIFGAVTSRDDLEDSEYIDHLKEIILSIAPHQVFLHTLREIGDAVDSPLAVISNLFAKVRIGELASLGQVANERISAMELLESKIDEKSDEKDLQKILEESPWLINAEWTLLGANVTFDTLRKRFERWFLNKEGTEIITSAIEAEKVNKRPDFVLLTILSRLEILEIKKPKEHRLSNEEFRRLHLYIRTLEQFLSENPEFEECFRNGVHATLVCDHLNLVDVEKTAFDTLVEKGQLDHQKWDEFLLRTRMRHEAFLEVARSRGRPAKTDRG